ncbi:MAG: mechanosensitive ion channel family protein [Acidobacteriota bacterium]
MKDLVLSKCLGAFLQAGFLSMLADEFAQEGAFWLALVIIIAASLLRRLAVQEQKHIRAALMLFGLYLVCLPLSSILQLQGFATSADYVKLLGKIFRYVSLINLGSLFIFGVILPSIRLDAPRIMRDTIMFISYVIMALSILSARGVNVSGIIATSAILTAVIGLSLQDTLGNIMAGLALQMEHVIKVGDWVKIDQYVGRVKEIRWRQTSIETRNWDTVVIPNSQLMKGQVLIYGRRENAPLQHRQWIYFHVDFRYSPSEVIARVNEALQAATIEHVAAEPKIHAILMDFKESYCQYAVRYWLTELAADDPTDSLVRIRIYYALKRANIPLSLPAHSVFITEENKKRQVRKQEREVEQRLEAIRTIDLFRTINEAELRELAQHLRYAPFSRGEVMTRQGSEGHWLYIITNGRASVRVAAAPSDNGALEKEVAQLRIGDFFGEMSLMTGEPRSATVVAVDDVECYRLDKEAFQKILVARPEIAEDISHILAQRRIKLDAVREGLDLEAHSIHVEATQNHILGLIRGFFGL